MQDHLGAMTDRNTARQGIEQRYLLAWGKRIDGQTAVYTADDAERAEGEQAAGESDQ